MSDLNGTPEDRFSHVAAQKVYNKHSVPMSNTYYPCPVFLGRAFPGGQPLVIYSSVLPTLSDRRSRGQWCRLPCTYDRQPGLTGVELYTGSVSENKRSRCENAALIIINYYAYTQVHIVT